jgi:hypothetical protein
LDRESVRKALSITPPVQGYFVWSQNKQTYNVPQDYGTYAWSGATLVSRVDAMSYDWAAPAAPATITTYNNVQSFTYYFNLSDCLTDTTYTVTLSKEALDTGGVALDSALSFSFSTVQSATAFDDIEMDPYNGEDYVDLMHNQGITITFPKRMDQASVEAHLRMVPSDTDAILLWKDYNKLAILTSGRILMPDTTYTITIDSAALDADGNVLGKTTVLSFSTRSIMVTGATPAYGDMMADPGSVLILSFNTYMDKNTFAGRIALVSGNGDTVAGTTDYYHYSTTSGTIWIKDRIMFDPSPLLANDEKYTLYVMPGVTDRIGRPMLQGYRLTFVTMP